MKLSRKFDISMLIIAAVIISVVGLSFRAIDFLSAETSRLLVLSEEFEYSSSLKNAVVNLENAIERYIYVRPAKENSDFVKRELANLQRILQSSEKLNPEGKEAETLQFAKKKINAFSEVVYGLLDDTGKLESKKKRELYSQWRKIYLEKILLDLDQRWKNDTAKVNTMFSNIQITKEKAFWIFLVTCIVMGLVFIGSMLIVSRQIIQPIRTIEEVSDAIAKGDTGKRIGIRSRDELGHLAGSINSMAEAIQEKISRLETSIAKEQAVVREQAILNELMGFIASGAEIDQVLRTFIFRVRDLLKAEYSGIFIFENHTTNERPVLKYFFNTVEENTPMDVADSMMNGLFRDVFKEFRSLRVNTLQGEAPDIHLEVKNVLAIPLSSADKQLLSLVVVANKQDGFTEEDEDVLFNFSFQAFQAIIMQQKIVHYATTDGLTGLNNHRVFIEKLDNEMERASRYSRDISLLMIDIDHFKSFNDTYGHQAGDDILKSLAARISASIRDTDFAARYGGEEFAIILPETTGPQALVVAERIRDNISRSNFVLGSGQSVSITASLGYASYPGDADNSVLLIKRADQGLYHAKETGRNRVSRYQSAGEKEKKSEFTDLEGFLSNTSLVGIRELVKAIDARTYFMKGHSFEVAVLSVMVAEKLGFEEEALEGLKIASLLHDIGNLSIPDHILNKAAPLAEEEKKIIQGHPGLMEMLLKHYPMSDLIIPAILYHHERFDGKGYPLGMKGEDIPLSARILAVVEAYNAMISSRPYRHQMTREEALAELEKEAGKQFDPQVVDLFVTCINTAKDPFERLRKKDS